MPEPHSFDYAVIRVVPRVEREEFVNVGVVLQSRQKKFLGVKVELREDRVKALWPDADIALVRSRLESFSRISQGDPAGGPIAKLPQSERFHWLTSPRSTIVQVSPVHSGICDDPQATLERLFHEHVALGS